MACCTPTAQKFWLTGCSVGALTLALLIGLLWPTISLKLFLYPQLVLKEGSVNYENWKETPIPIYLDIFFFNWTNHENAIANHSIKPHFTEMGPYSFKSVFKFLIKLLSLRRFGFNFLQRKTYQNKLDLELERYNNILPKTNMGIFFGKIKRLVNKSEEFI